MEMSSKMQKNPSIRFKGFTDAWEQRKLGDVSPLRGGYAFQSEKFRSQGVPIIRISNILSDGNIGGNYAFYDEQETDDKYSLPDGAALLAMSGATTGKVAILSNPDNTKFYQNQRVGYFSDLKIVNYDFVSTIVRSNLFISQLSSVLVAGAQPNVSSKEIDSFGFYFPKTLKEQTKLGIFFKQLDETIALHQRQLDNYKALKKVMLQKIFNQELRFKDQEGNNYPDWEKIALNELGETYTGLSGKTKENFGKGKGRFVTYMNVYSNPIADLAMTENVEIKDGENQNEVCYGDIFFTTSSETPEEVGMSSVWLSHESKVYLNSFCFGYRLSSRSEGVISPDFLGFQLRAPHIRKKIIFLAQGSTRFNISKSKLMDIVVYMPTIEEQNKITAFLLNVDSRIKHTIQSIERLNMLKKALLQQMFI